MNCPPHQQVKKTKQGFIPRFYVGGVKFNFISFMLVELNL